MGMDHALYFLPENNIGKVENVFPHCEVDVLIVNIERYPKGANYRLLVRTIAHSTLMN